jgi:hypothetical protein
MALPVARRMLVLRSMKPQQPTPRDPNQGEGDRTSARRYNKDARDFVAEGKVPKAASEARDFVDAHPVEAARAERTAKRGPSSSVTVDLLIARGQTILDRVKHAAARVRARIEARRAAKKTTDAKNGGAS